MAKKAKKMIEALKKDLNCEGAELVDEIKRKSSAAAGLYKWAASTDQYYDVFRMAEPKKQECARLQKQSDEASA